MIAGRGSDTVLRTLARDLGVEERVEFAGEVSESRLRVLLNAAKVVVLPSIDRCEAFGISLLEAMACGKPIVTTDLPTGVRFVNRDEVTGLCVPPGDPAALSAAVNRLLDDPMLQARLGENGRTRVHEELSVDRMVQRILAVYEDVSKSTDVLGSAARRSAVRAVDPLSSSE